MNSETSQLDCRGLACPEPVVRTKEALAAQGAQGALCVLVDGDVPRDNVRRFAESQGGAVSVEPAGEGGWQVTIRRGGAGAASAPRSVAASDGAAAFLVTNDQLGPEPELGRVLMRALLGTIGKVDPRPGKLLFLNRGVLLTTEGSDVLEILRELECSGVEILSCGTCLDFFHRKEVLRVGRISNMYETLEALTGGRAVTLS